MKNHPHGLQEYEYNTIIPEKVGKNNLIPDVLSSEPYNFALLCKIQGFSCSSNGWYDNGELLVRNHIVNVKSIPVFHEDIFTDIAHALNRQGIRDNGLALQVMNAIKNGCYFLDGMPTSVETVLRAIGLPDWYPEYLKKLEFLIAKGSCLTMLLARLILTWYRINYPEEYARIEHRLQYIDAQFQ